MSIVHHLTSKTRSDGHHGIRELSPLFHVRAQYTASMMSRIWSQRHTSSLPYRYPVRLSEWVRDVQGGDYVGTACNFTVQGQALKGVSTHSSATDQLACSGLGRHHPSCSLSKIRAEANTIKSRIKAGIISI